MSDFYISRIKASNFKRFDNIDISLKRFNIIAGPGRAELLQLFSFIWHTRNMYFEDVMTLHDWRGPVLKDADNSTLCIECHFKSDSHKQILQSLISSHLTMTTDTIVCRFSIRFEGKHCRVIDNKITADYVLADPKSGKIRGKVTVGETGIRMEPNPGVMCRGMPVMESRFHSPLLGHDVITKLVSPEWDTFLSQMSVYDFVCPEYLKSKSSKDETVLEHHGTNLSGVLLHMSKNPKMMETLHSSAGGMIPAFEGISTKIKSGSAEFYLCKKNLEPIPADVVLDEDVRILALLVCLILPRSFSVIESPERDISSKTVQKLAKMMAGLPGCGQMVVSTSSPEMLRYTMPGNVLTVSSDADGRFHVHKADGKEIKDLQRIPESENDKKSTSKLHVTEIRVEIKGKPPKKATSVSIWGDKQSLLTMNLRMEIHKEQKKAGITRPFEDLIGIELDVYAPSVRNVGDLDSLVAGVCDAIQPAHINVRKSDKKFPGPKEIGPGMPLLIYNDSQIVKIVARKTKSDSSRYTLIVRLL